MKTKEEIKILIKFITNSIKFLIFGSLCCAFLINPIFNIAYNLATQQLKQNQIIMLIVAGIILITSLIIIILRIRKIYKYLRSIYVAMSMDLALMTNTTEREMIKNIVLNQDKDEKKITIH